MKKMKMIAGLIAALLVSVQPAVHAQNLVSQLYSSAIGVPGVILNSASTTNYGQIFNSAGAASSVGWNLGYGAQSSFLPNGQPLFNANGTSVVYFNTSGQVATNSGNTGAPALQTGSLWQVNSVPNASSNAYYSLAYNSNGWLEFRMKANVTPLISSCGTSPSFASGVDEAGDVTVGTSPSNTCTVTFASSASNVPHCTCTSGTYGSVCQVTSPSTNGFTMKVSGNNGELLQNDRLDWVCLGHNVY